MDMRVRDVDPEIHTAFKLTCMANGITMENQVKKLLAEFVEREGVVAVNIRRKRGKVAATA